MLRPLWVSDNRNRADADASVRRACCNPAQIPPRMEHPRSRFAPGGVRGGTGFKLGRVAPSTLRPPRLRLMGTGTEDDAWKTRKLRCTCSGWSNCGCGGNRRDRTSPHSNQGGVAFPTLRPPRLWFCRGPAPWTKRGKRAAAVALVQVGAAAGPGTWRHRQKPNRGDTKTDPLQISGAALTGIEHRPIQCADRESTEVQRTGARSGRNIAPFKSRQSCVSHPSTTAPLVLWRTGTVDEAWKTPRRRRFWPGSVRQPDLVSSDIVGNRPPASNKPTPS